jgi:hypothetical protein
LACEERAELVNLTRNHNFQKHSTKAQKFACMFFLVFTPKGAMVVILDRALETQRGLACEGANFLGLKSGEAFHILSRSDQGGLNLNSSECMM